jgi:hypothetical protein
MIEAENPMNAASLVTKSVSGTERLASGGPSTPLRLIAVVLFTSCLASSQSGNGTSATDLVNLLTYQTLPCCKSTLFATVAVVQRM